MASVRQSSAPANYARALRWQALAKDWQARARRTVSDVGSNRCRIWLLFLPARVSVCLHQMDTLSLSTTFISAEMARRILLKSFRQSRQYSRNPTPLIDTWGRLLRDLFFA